MITKITDSKGGNKRQNLKVCSPKRIFKNRTFKHQGSEISFYQDSYTDNEMCVHVCTTFGVSTLIRKSALKGLALALKDGNPDYYTDESDYSNGWLKYELRENGISFTVKGIISNTVWIPASKAENIVDFLTKLA